MSFWSSNKNSHTWSCDSLVQSSRNSTLPKSILDSSRFLVDRMHFCRVSLAKTTFLWRFWNRLDFQNFPNLRNSKWAPLERCSQALWLQTNIPQMETKISYRTRWELRCVRHGSSCISSGARPCKMNFMQNGLTAPIFWRSRQIQVLIKLCA